MIPRRDGVQPTPIGSAATAIMLVGTCVPMGLFCIIEGLGLGAMLHSSSPGAIRIMNVALGAFLLFMVVFVHSDQRWHWSLILDSEGIHHSAGRKSADIPWDSISDITVVFDANGASQWTNRMNSGVRIVVDGPATTTTRRAPLPHQPDEPVIINLGQYSVDPETLINAVIALHEHPELRKLLTTDDRTLLVAGPNWKELGLMKRRQIWEPWGDRLRAALERQVAS